MKLNKILQPLFIYHICFTLKTSLVVSFCKKEKFLFSPKMFMSISSILSTIWKFYQEFQLELKILKKKKKKLET